MEDNYIFAVSVVVCEGLYPDFDISILIGWLPIFWFQYFGVFDIRVWYMKKLKEKICFRFIFGFDMVKKT